MDIVPQIFIADVMHKRLFPKVNSFNYGVYYLVLPLPATKIPGILNRFDPRDLGYRDGSDPSTYANSILAKYDIATKIDNIMLITMPRVLGYLFNPVSFYLCLDSENQIRAVIAEVHNTFGEQHSYLCVNPDHSPIKATDWMEADKLFHVSPFLERNGHYRFRFSLEHQKIGLWIDYFDKENNKQLITSLTGKLQPLTEKSLRKAFWSHPLVTLKTILLIHLQALKLLSKGIRHLSKPQQSKEKTSVTKI